jgi:hypothetical protein
MAIVSIVSAVLSGISLYLCVDFPMVMYVSNLPVDVSVVVTIALLPWTFFFGDSCVNGFESANIWCWNCYLQ